MEYLLLNDLIRVLIRVKQLERCTNTQARRIQSQSGEDRLNEERVGRRRGQASTKDGKSDWKTWKEERVCHRLKSISGRV